MDRRRSRPLSADDRARILNANAALASDGQRVLGVAFCPLADPDPALTDGQLIFLGLIGMLDPPRPEAQRAVQSFVTAGIRPILITGDHPLTVSAASRHLGIGGVRVLSGRDLDTLDDTQLEHVVDTTSVYARVAPEHKLRIVSGLQRRGDIVAMTGDGANDAPALKQANIGVAMWLVGTDVARQAADMVLLDDNFATIVAAVEEGRVIYDNIRKFLKYLLTTNAGELWVMLLGPMLGMPLSLAAAADPLDQPGDRRLAGAGARGGAPGAGCPATRPAPTVRKSPGGRDGLAHRLGGAAHGGVTLALGLWIWHNQNPAWQSMVFTTLALLQMGHMLAIRIDQASLLGRGFLGNHAVLGSVLVLIGLQLAVLYVPVLQSVFVTLPLSYAELGVCVVASTSVFWAVEAEKWVRRRKIGAAAG